MKWKFFFLVYNYSKIQMKLFWKKKIYLNHFLQFIAAETERKRICFMVSRAKYSIKRQSHQWTEASITSHCRTRKAYSRTRQKGSRTKITVCTENSSSDHCKHASKVKSKGGSVKEVSTSSGKSQRGIMLCYLIYYIF